LFSDAVISGIVLLLLVSGLVLVDPRVREHMARFLGKSGPAAAADVTTEFAGVASAIVIAARDQSIDHAPMVLFVVVATVLFLAMFRS
jgi:hypothetical protein